MPSDRKLRSTVSLTSGSSRSISRGAISTCVTWLPSRAKACASSQPIGPPPSTSSRRGSVRMFQSVSDVR